MGKFWGPGMEKVLLDMTVCEQNGFVSLLLLISTHSSLLCILERTEEFRNPPQLAPSIQNFLCRRVKMAVIYPVGYLWTLVL